MRLKYWFGIGLVLLVAVIVLSNVFTTKKNTVTYVQPTKTYIALGDSVAAGIGLNNYTDSSACNRTYQAYPFVLAKKMNYKLTSFACSGATIASGILGPQNVNDLMIKPQIDQLFQQNKPTLITLTIGANDAGWSDVLASCYLGQCDTPDQNQILSTKMQELTVNLSTTLSMIQSHYSNPPKTVVTGYYQVFPNNLTNCQELSKLTNPDITWLGEQYANLNNAIKSSTIGFNFASYVVPDFSIHPLCSSNPWVQNFNSNAPFHPNSDGQNEYVRVIK
jgi:lysophospholipase L1-like esterase